jgi:hypothetical protein
MPNIAALKMQNPLAIPALLAFSTPKSPTRFYEDPEKKWLLVGAICESRVEFQEAAFVLTGLLASVCLTTTFLPLWEA